MSAPITFPHLFVIFATFFMRLLSYSRKWNSISMCWCKIITSQRTFGYNNKICWIIFTVKRHFPRFHSATKVRAANAMMLIVASRRDMPILIKVIDVSPAELFYTPRFISTRRLLLQNFRCWFIVFFVSRFQSRLAIILIELWSFIPFSSWAESLTWSWTLWYKMHKTSGICWSF